MREKIKAMLSFIGWFKKDRRGFLKWVIEKDGLVKCPFCGEESSKFLEDKTYNLGFSFSKFYCSNCKGYSFFFTKKRKWIIKKASSMIFTSKREKEKRIYFKESGDWHYKDFLRCPACESFDIEEKVEQYSMKSYCIRLTCRNCKHKDQNVYPFIFDL